MWNCDPGGLELGGQEALGEGGQLHVLQATLCHSSIAASSPSLRLRVQPHLRTGNLWPGPGLAQQAGPGEGVFCHRKVSQCPPHTYHPRPRTFVLLPRAPSSVPALGNPIRGAGLSLRALPNPASVEALWGCWRGFQAGAGGLWPLRIRTCTPRKEGRLLRPGAVGRMS